MLLTEGFVFGAASMVNTNNLTESDKKIMSESGQFGKIMLKGICQAADTKNGNGRIYPRHILEREVKKYQKIIKENRGLGELDHPDDSVINLKNVSHRLVELWWDGNNVMCKLLVLDNRKVPSGELAAGLLEEGVLLGISSRGLGSVKDDYKNGGTIVEEDFGLICFDLVSEPSTPNAFQYPVGERRRYSESKENKNNINSLIDDILKG